MSRVGQNTAPAEVGREMGALADLFPGYFALVMATGIIAVGALQQGIMWLAWGLLWANVGFYAVLWTLYVLRLLRYRAEFLTDLTGRQRGPSFLTMVAGTNVLGAASSRRAGCDGCDGRCRPGCSRGCRGWSGQQRRVPRPPATATARRRMRR